MVKALLFSAFVAFVGSGCTQSASGSNLQPTIGSDSDAGTGGGGGSGSSSDAGSASSTPLPVDQIEAIIGATGHVDNGVLSIDIERKDLGSATAMHIQTWTPAFELEGTLYFQSLGNGEAILNGDLNITEDEANPFIDALIANGLIFQAFHQHAPTHPQYWFIHFRGICDPITLAHDIRNAIDVTKTPLPQPPPAGTTPLDPARLASILHGTAEVGDEGVVTVTVPRTDTIVLGGVTVKPELGVSPTIEFKPTGSGSQAQVVPDFGMTAAEHNKVILLMRSLGWLTGCLYNQETDEHPQLYFDHMLKNGDAYQLAAEIRRGLDLMAVK